MDQFDDQYYLPPANFPRLLSTDRPPSHRGLSQQSHYADGASQAGSVHSRASRGSRASVRSAASRASIRSASTWNRKDWKPPIQREVRYPFADESKPLPAAILADGPSWSEAKLRFSPKLRRPESGRGDWGSVLQGNAEYTRAKAIMPPFGFPADHDLTMMQTRAAQGNVYTPPPRVRTVPGTSAPIHRLTEYEGRLQGQPAYPKSAQHFGYEGSVLQRGAPLQHSTQKLATQRLAEPKCVGVGSSTFQGATGQGGGMGDTEADVVLLKSMHSIKSPQVIDPLFNTRLNVSVVHGDIAARAPHRPLHRRLQGSQPLYPSYLHSTFTTKSYNTRERAFL